MKPPFVICGATGNVGSKAAEALLGAGEPVRAIARDRARLAPLAAKGAEAWPGDIADGAFVEKAFTGAGAAFVMIPPRYDAPDFRAYQARVAESLASAVARTRVPRVVTLSSVGAHLPGGTGPIAGLHDLEAKLGSLREAAVIHLRPAFFMENHLWSVPLIRAQGVNGSALRPDLPIPMIATKDIADAAARILLDRARTGHAVHYLLGPRDLTMSEATRILGEAVGNPALKYVRFPDDDVRKAMIEMGMSETVADDLLEMDHALNDGRVRPTKPRSTDNTTPTTLEDFARTVFAPAFRAAA